jgi:hypothetical protein
VRRGRCILALLPLALALLAGCGPTTGGTGTGESIGLSRFGATAASTCSAPFAAALACGSTSLSPVAPGQLPGTGAVVFVGDAASGAYVLTMQDNRAVLQGRCDLLRFEGDWGLRPDGQGRFFGRWGAAAAEGVQPAQLELQLRSGSDRELLAQVQDIDGRPLLGPLALRPVAAVPTEPPACR